MDGLSELIIEASEHPGIIKDPAWLGTRLRLRDTTVEEIMGNAKLTSLKDKCYQMMKSWRQERGSDATTQALVRQLQDMGFKDIAERYMNRSAASLDKVSTPANRAGKLWGQNPHTGQNPQPSPLQTHHQAGLQQDGASLFDFRSSNKNFVQYNCQKCTSVSGHTHLIAQLVDKHCKELCEVKSELTSLREEKKRLHKKVKTELKLVRKENKRLHHELKELKQHIANSAADPLMSFAASSFRDDNCFVKSPSADRFASQDSIRNINETSVREKSTPSVVHGVNVEQAFNISCCTSKDNEPSLQLIKQINELSKTLFAGNGICSSSEMLFRKHVELDGRKPSVSNESKQTSVMANTVKRNTAKTPDVKSRVDHRAKDLGSRVSPEVQNPAKRKHREMCSTEQSESKARSMRNCNEHVALNEYFVGNICESVTRETILRYLSQHGVQVKALFVSKSKRSGHKFAKLTIDKEDCAVLESLFWPRSVYARKWIVR